MTESDLQLAISGKLRADLTVTDAFAVAALPMLGPLLRIAMAILGSESEARDALQDSLADAWAGIDGLRDSDRFEPWLTRILVNRCRMALRRRAVRRRHDARSSAMGARLPPTPDIADRVGMRDELERAFDGLPPEDRLILVLRYLEELSIRDIAGTLHVPEGTVKSRLFRARRSLAVELHRDVL